MKIEITHDFMETYGGAERVTAEMALAFPDAQVRAIIGRASVAARMGVGDRFTSLLPARARLLDHYRLLAPGFPALVASRRIRGIDLLLSSSYAFAHHFRTEPTVPHLCYLHSPLRFAWTMTHAYRQQTARGHLARKAFSGMAAAMRVLDSRAAGSVTRFATQSPYVAQQVERFFDRPADVIGAPIDSTLFRPSGRDPSDYYLLCGRLIEPYKRMGIVIRAFRHLRGERLVVAGDGPAMAELRAIAPDNVEFTGHLGDDRLVELMQDCKALIFPSQDDFGLIPVEAMACGRPVLAYGQGGALYTVRPKVTGDFFHEQTSDAVLDAVRRFDPGTYETGVIRRHAEQWDAAAFRARLVGLAADLMTAPRS